MIKKNPVNVELVRGNKLFTFTVVEVMDTTSNQVEFEFHKRSLNVLELSDMAKHLRVPLYHAEKMVLDVAKQQYGGKIFKEPNKKPASRFSMNRNKK